MSGIEDDPIETSKEDKLKSTFGKAIDSIFGVLGGPPYMQLPSAPEPSFLEVRVFVNNIVSEYRVPEELNPYKDLLNQITASKIYDVLEDIKDRHVLDFVVANNIKKKLIKETGLSIIELTGKIFKFTDLGKNSRLTYTVDIDLTIEISAELKAQYIENKRLEFNNLLKDLY